MEIYIIRHAESANNAAPLENRVDDPTLSTVGYKQADFLAGRLRHICPDRILVSPFRRTLETIAPYLKDTDVTPEAWIDIHEQGGVVQVVPDPDNLWKWCEEHFARNTSLFTRKEFSPANSAGDDELVGTNFERKYKQEGRPFHATTLLRVD